MNPFTDLPSIMIGELGTEMSLVWWENSKLIGRSLKGKVSFHVKLE